MKRFQGLAIVLILGLIVVVASVIKRPSSSSKISENLDQSSQHNSSGESSPARAMAADSEAPAPAQNSRSMSQTTATQRAAPVARMASRAATNFVQHELSPIKRNISDSELRNTEVVGGNWKLVSSLYAVPQALLSTADAAAAVGEQNGFTFFEANGANLQESLFSNERSLVVYDSRLQAYGVVTGTIQIDLRKGSNVSGLLQDYGAKVQHAFPETGTYYITAQDQPFNLVQFKNSLEADSRVDRVEVEIVGRRYGKQ